VAESPELDRTLRSILARLGVRRPAPRAGSLLESSRPDPLCVRPNVTLPRPPAL
jgi:hypothetical protein